MKKNLFWLCALLLAGCMTPPQIAPILPNEFIDQAIYANTTKDKVYSACLTAMQFQGLTIHPLGTSKESGLIITEEETFTPTGYNDVIQAHYKFQVLVSEVQGVKVMIDFNLKVGWKYVGSGDTTQYFSNPMNKTNLNNTVNNDVGIVLGTIFNQIDILVGKAEFYRRRTIKWQS